MTHDDDYGPPDDSEDGEYNTPFNVEIRAEPDIAAYSRRWQALPQAIKDVGMATETAEYIEEQIRPRFGLSREQTRAITFVLRNLLMSESYLGDIVRDIQSKLSVDEPTARTMADTLFREILQPIRSDLQALHQERFPERSGSAHESS